MRRFFVAQSLLSMCTNLRDLLKMPSRIGPDLSSSLLPE